jgi:hypothetical protein
MTNKIYWYGYKQQLKELYCLLYYGKYISARIDEFMPHFTGKKFRMNKRIFGKLKWNNEGYLLILIINHLHEKRFINYTSIEDFLPSLKKHFNGINASSIKDYNKNKTAAAKKLQKKLDNIFPESSGYRCKERLYYLQRNREHVIFW